MRLLELVTLTTDRNPRQNVRDGVRCWCGSNATRSGGVDERALASTSRPTLHEGFLRDVGASASRAARSSPRPGRA